MRLSTMTFMEFVCHKLLGPPTKSGSREGESFWRCPFCGAGHDKFHTLPHRPGGKDYVKCFRCPFWGDEYNLLRSLRDLGGYPLAAGGFDEHQALLAGWHKEWEAGPKLNVSTGRKNGEPNPATGFFRPVEALIDRVEAAWDRLSAKEKSLLADAHALARRAGVPLADLARYCCTTLEAAVAGTEEHLARCVNPACPESCCVRKRRRNADHRQRL
jgi:hypothetical protein